MNLRIQKKEINCMKINRKLTLWLLLVGMICMPTEQVQARMMSNNTMYAIACTTLGAASYVAYMVYQDYYKKQVDIETKRIADNNDDQEDEEMSFDEKMSFDEGLNFFVTQFEGEKLANDFDIRIFALFMTCFSIETSLEFIAEMKDAAHKQSAPISMKHFEDIIFQNTLTYDYKNVNGQQSLLDRAYHQAAHAVAIIELMNPNMALYSVSLNGSNSPFGGFLSCPLVSDVSDEDALKAMEDTIMYYLAGGIGEQLFNVSPLPRCNDFDISDHDENSDNYDYIDMVTRESVVYNMENVVTLANMLIYFNYLDAGGSDSENFIVGSADRYDLAFSLYKKLHTILAENNDKIKKLAELLVEKGTVYADEAYAICGKKRPLFYFEKE